MEIGRHEQGPLHDYKLLQENQECKSELQLVAMPLREYAQAYIYSRDFLQLLFRAERPSNMRLTCEMPWRDSCANIQQES